MAHDRRQPAAAHALRVLPRHRFRLQQARARLRLPGDRGREPRCTRSSASASTASPRIPPTCRWRWWRSSARRAAGADGGDARACRSREFHRLPGDTPHIETVLRPGELITAIVRPGRRRGAALALPEGARPRLLRVRAGLGRGGTRDRGRRDPRRARRAGRRRHEALARCRRWRRRCAASSRRDVLETAAARAADGARARAARQRFQDRAGRGAPAARAADRRRPEESRA